MDRSSLGTSRDDIAEALEQASILTARYLSDRSALSPTAALALNTLSREGSIRLTALAAATGISQPSMTELVQRLERQGLMNRVNDPEDGRAALVCITDGGRALLDERWHYRRDRLAELLTDLSPQQEAALTLAMHVALPTIRQLIEKAASPAPKERPVAAPA
jgi:DNA-binding MarR family transcriptional regulator